MPTFDELLDQVRELLQSRGRLSYRALKRRFDLNDEYLEDIKEELIKAERVAIDEDGTVLIWTGGDTATSDAAQQPSSLPSHALQNDPPPVAPIERQSSEADRRQLTVMFCDLVGSTPMSAQLDPEDYRDIMQAYQEMCGQVLARFTGHIARYEGDGILVYFGYPQAQEDAAAQAVRAGLQIIEGLPDLNVRLQPRFALLRERPLQVRIGMHTGLVVVGEMGSEQYRVDIAVGETPNMAARIQGQAGPNEVIISAATYKLVEGLFECEDQGQRELKGIVGPQAVYQIRAESAAQSRFDIAVQKGLTPLVGRTEELALLTRCWQQAKSGKGQAVLLSGEPGIGKSRLVQELKEQATHEGATRIEFRCSPSHQNSALYPAIAHVERLLQFQHTDKPKDKLEKLQQTLRAYAFVQDDTVPLLSSLLSLPSPKNSPLQNYSPQKQKKRTLETLVEWLFEEAEQTAVCCLWEDLHWADPSTLELLTLYLEHLPAAQILTLLVFRPEFIPPWNAQPYLHQLSLNRLGRPQIEGMVIHITDGRALPAEVTAEIALKTDGVPLFVEELTKTVLESGIVQPVNHHYELTGSLSAISIPSTLQDSLMARLDRLNTAKEIAQLGATIGREFSYPLLRAVSPRDEAAVQQALNQLVKAELVHQHGSLPEVQYVFKHALIQETAYQSLLKSTRQQYHQQIAQVIEKKFPETVETQPELLAHHYTEARRTEKGLLAYHYTEAEKKLVEKAILYWQTAGQKAIEHSANVEAIEHLTKGIDLLQTLPSTPGHIQQELILHVNLGVILMTIQGYASPEVERVHARMWEICQQSEDSFHLLLALPSLRGFHMARGELQRARELAEQYFPIAQSFHTPLFSLWAHYGLGEGFLYAGEFVAARDQYEKGLAFCNLKEFHRSLVPLVQDPEVASFSQAASALWILGYPDQALQRIDEALTLAQTLSHPFSLAWAHCHVARQHQLRREGQLSGEWAQRAVALCTEQGFSFWLAQGKILQGWALAEQGQTEEGIAQLRQGIVGWQTTRAEMWRPYYLAQLAEAHGRAGQVEEGLSVLTEALTAAEKYQMRWWQAELYRLKGELTLQQFKVQGSKFQIQEEAEACFRKAIDIARHQQAKSWELRTATGLARLWQSQGKTTEARDLLAPVYNWFTEGFDTADLKDAKALLNALSEGV